MRIVNILLKASIIAVALLVSAAGTAFAIDQLSGADSDVEGY